MAEREMPTGVKVISVLYYVGAAFSFLFGLLLITKILSEWIWITRVIVFSGMIIGLGIFLSLGLDPHIGFEIVFLIFGAAIFIGRGLWKGQNWARIAAIVLAIFSILGASYSLISIFSQFKIGGWFLTSGAGVIRLSFAFVQLAVSLLIGGYLAFAHEVKEAFAQ